MTMVSVQIMTQTFDTTKALYLQQSQVFCRTTGVFSHFSLDEIFSVLSIAHKGLGIIPYNKYYIVYCTVITKKVAVEVSLPYIILTLDPSMFALQCPLRSLSKNEMDSLSCEKGK